MRCGVGWECATSGGRGGGRRIPLLACVGFESPPHLKPLWFCWWCWWWSCVHSQTWECCDVLIWRQPCPLRKCFGPPCRELRCCKRCASPRPLCPHSPPPTPRTPAHSSSPTVVRNELSVRGWWVHKSPLYTAGEEAHSCVFVLEVGMLPAIQEFKVRGLCAATFTAFGEDGSLNLDAVAAQVRDGYCVPTVWHLRSPSYWGKGGKVGLYHFFAPTSPGYSLWTCAQSNLLLLCTFLPGSR